MTTELGDEPEQTQRTRSEQVSEAGFSSKGNRSSRDSSCWCWLFRQLHVCVCVCVCDVGCHHFLASSFVILCLLPILVQPRFFFITRRPGRLSTI